MLESRGWDAVSKQDLDQIRARVRLNGHPGTALLVIASFLRFLWRSVIRVGGINHLKS